MLSSDYMPDTAVGEPRASRSHISQEFVERKRRESVEGVEELHFAETTGFGSKLAELHPLVGVGAGVAEWVFENCLEEASGKGRKSWGEYQWAKSLGQ
jgi:hypothetical protein